MYLDREQWLSGGTMDGMKEKDEMQETVAPRDAAPAAPAAASESALKAWRSSSE